MVRQVSIFAENSRGALRNITSALKAVNVNIIALVTNDSAAFGIVRMIVDDADAAVKALRDAGYMVHCDSVLVVDIDDGPGGLDQLLTTINDARTNIDYLYISYDRVRSTPGAVIHSLDYAELESCLRSNGWKVL